MVVVAVPLAQFAVSAVDCFAPVPAVYVWQQLQSVRSASVSGGVAARSPSSSMTAVASSRDVAALSLLITAVCSKDVEAPFSLTAVAAAETLRRHTRRLLLRQQRRCGVTLADCCCGSRDVAASHSQTAVPAAETLRRHTRRLLLRQQRRCGVTLADCCCGSRDVAASHSQTAVAAAETLRRHTRRLLLRQQ